MLEDGDLAGVCDLVRSEFLLAGANALGDMMATIDARRLAERLADLGDEWADVLLKCAFQYCTLAERVRGASQALEGLIRRGEIQCALKAVEIETDPFRRGAIAVVVSSLLADAGYKDIPKDLFENGPRRAAPPGRLWDHGHRRSYPLF